MDLENTTRFDAAEYLDTPEAIEAFLEDAFEDSDPAFIAHALGIVARARGMGEIADKAGVSRQALYKSLSDEGNPNLTTLLGVLKALGFRLAPVPVPEHA